MNRYQKPSCLVALILASLLVVIGCNRGPSSHDREKRNHEWIWLEDSATTQGRWARVSDSLTDFTGHYELFYCNGNLMEKGYQRAGKKVDTMDFFDLDGELHFQWYVDTNGEEWDLFPEGPFTLYHPNCALKATGRIENGIVVGERLQYHEDGKTLNYSEYYLNDSVTLQEVFNERGIRIDSNGFLHNSYHGQCKGWFLNGQLKTDIMFDRGNYQGTYREYYRNGQLKCDAQYANGKLEGPATWYFPNGGIEVAGIYTEGFAIDYKEYDRSGNLLEDFKDGELTDYREEAINL